jgi:hypothetical protein
MEGEQAPKRIRPANAMFIYNPDTSPCTLSASNVSFAICGSCGDYLTDRPGFACPNKAQHTWFKDRLDHLESCNAEFEFRYERKRDNEGEKVVAPAKQWQMGEISSNNCFVYAPTSQMYKLSKEEITDQFVALPDYIRRLADRGPSIPEMEQFVQNLSTKKELSIPEQKAPSQDPQLVFEGHYRELPSYLRRLDDRKESDNPEEGLVSTTVHPDMAQLFQNFPYRKSNNDW